MKEVFVLFHAHELRNGEDDEKLIGVYSMASLAEAALERAKKLRGFVDYPDGFIIDQYKLDEDHWTEGFITWAEALGESDR